MPLWLSPQPLVLASKSDVRGKMLAAVGLRFEIRPAQIDERAVEAERRHHRCRRRRPLSRARQGRARWRARCPAAWCWAPTRRWRAAPRASASRQTAPRPPSSCAPCAGARTSCIPRSRWCATAPCCSIASTARELTMRNISDRFLEDYLDMAGDAALASVGAYQLEGLGIHLFERVEGDYFTILGLPLLPLLAYLRQNEFGGRLTAVTCDVHSRPDRLARHGKIRHGENVRRGGRARARCRRRRAPAL